MVWPLIRLEPAHLLPALQGALPVSVRDLTRAEREACRARRPAPPPQPRAHGGLPHSPEAEPGPFRGSPGVGRSGQGSPVGRAGTEPTSWGPACPPGSTSRSTRRGLGLTSLRPGPCSRRCYTHLRPPRGLLRKRGQTPRSKALGPPPGAARAVGRPPPGPSTWRSDLLDQRGGCRSGSHLGRWCCKSRRSAAGRSRGGRRQPTPPQWFGPPDLRSGRGDPPSPPASA